MPTGKCNVHSPYTYEAFPSCHQIYHPPPHEPDDGVNIDKTERRKEQFHC